MVIHTKRDKALRGKFYPGHTLPEMSASGHETLLPSEAVMVQAFSHRVMQGTTRVNLMLPRANTGEPQRVDGATSTRHLRHSA